MSSEASFQHAAEGEQEQAKAAKPDQHEAPSRHRSVVAHQRRGGRLPGDESGEIFGRVRQAILNWFSGDPFPSSKTAACALRCRDRVLAAALACITFYSAVDLYSISYTLRPALHFGLVGIIAAVAVALYWTILTCLLFSRYDRNADFVHVFRLAFVFQVFVLSIGALGNFAGAKIVSLMLK